LKLNTLTFKRLGINTQHEHIAYMREECQVCTSEGFEALTRVVVSNGKESVVTSLNTVRNSILSQGEISLSESAIHVLKVKDGDQLTVSHLHSIASLGFVRSKIYGNRLSAANFDAIMKDIVKGNYSNVHLSAFITACASNELSTKEIISLTQAMINTGEQMNWHKSLVVDKHCIGGLPGNRTTPIVVSIVTALGLTMPKTSSRAITSPAGTADTIEVMTPVNLTYNKIKKVVEKEGGCFVWGGTAQLSPADEILIRIEKALDIDSSGQLIASVLSKKVAAGSNHVIIDMPVGVTAKLRSIDDASRLKIEMEKVAHAVGLKMKVEITDGSQPVGRGIGPSLEARDVLMVLRNEENAPKDLKERALLLAGELLELSEKVEFGLGNGVARDILESGKAYAKFMAICYAQGGFTEPTISKYQHEIKSKSNGVIATIDNRKIAKLAKLAGAPENKTAGIDFLSPIGTKVEKGQTLYVIHSESEGELNYAMDYYHSQKNITTVI
jgi:thymidine phosphorylase